ncbi:MAG TPA: hypothetical protein ENH82_01645 [bacterium]|nr:hypothetical protein [bacterium]
MKKDLVDRRSFFKKAGLFTAGTFLPNKIDNSSAGQKPHGFYEDNILMRTLGRTGLKVSAIGIGTIPLFRSSYEEHKAVIDKGQELGINIIDTARAYNKGISEEYVGKA